MEKKFDEDSENPHKAAIRRNETSQYLRTLGQAVKNASESLREFGWSYTDTDEHEREAIVRKTDQFIMELFETWNLLRDRVGEF